MLDVLPAHEIITREKHFLDLIALGMSAASLTLSTINTAKISALEKKIALNNKRLDHLVDIKSLHKQHFKAVDQKLDDIANQLAIIMSVNKAHFTKLSNFMEQKFGTAIKIAEKLIRRAYKNRLAPGALNHDVLLQIIDCIDEVAAKSELLSFVHQPSDLFLVETSFIYKPEEKIFILVLHVPLVAPHNLMPLLEFIPLPMVINVSGNVSVTPEVGPNNMIAVGHSNAYQIISSSDLHSCNKMGETYFCKGRNLLLTDLTKTCLRSLYLADPNSIQTCCQFSIGGELEKIFRLDSNMFVIYSLGKINTNHICPKKKSISAIQHHHEDMVKSAQHHRLAPGALPHDILDKILNHTLSVARKMNMVYFVNYASDLFQVEVSHLYDPKTPHFTLGHSKSYQTISSTDVHLFLHLVDTFFCKGRQVMGKSLKKSNAEAI
jgi:hypothetical protein